MNASMSDHCANSPRVSGQAEQRLGIRTGNGGEFSHESTALQFSGNCVQQIGVGFGIHLPPQDLLRALHGEDRDLGRRLSLARNTSCSISAFAPAMIRSPSAFAWPFASSTSSAARLSAWLRMSWARWRASRTTSSARLDASSRSCLPRSAAASPSAICFWRVSIARSSGGQTNLAREPDEDAERDGLRDQRQIDVHGCSLARGVAAAGAVTEK